MLTVKKNDIDCLTEAVYQLLSGKKVDPLMLPADYPDNELKQCYEYFNRLTIEYATTADFIYSLSRGELDYDAPQGNMVVLQSFKSLQANLKHLTWVTQQIAEGNFDHTVNFMGDFSAAFNSMTRQLKEAFDKIQEQNIQLQAANEIIRKDKDKINSLLNSILPEKVIHELETTGRTTPKLYDNVTVFFSDIVDFTTESSKIDPVMLIDELNGVFTMFDNIVNETQGERIKTIGDAFLAVWGMHDNLDNHAVMAVKAAKQIIEALQARNDSWFIKWQVRIGIHTGSVVGGVVGTTKFIYDIFGDTVNVVSRLESNSEPMRINISEVVHQQVKNVFSVQERGNIYVKGKGDLKMYFVK